MHFSSTEVFSCLVLVTAFMASLSSAVPLTSQNHHHIPAEAEDEFHGLGNNGMMFEELHAIDVCIFTCDLCFKAEALVSCANTCIITNGGMDRNWKRICTAFLHEATHPQGFP